MSRPQIRTRTVTKDEIEKITGLFGTIRNAHRQLGLEGLVSYMIFYQALQFKPVKPTDYAEILDAWIRWQQLYLRPEVPEADPLALNPMNRDAWPDWHPEAARHLPKPYATQPTKNRSTRAHAGN